MEEVDDQEKQIEEAPDAPADQQGNSTQSTTPPELAADEADATVVIDTTNHSEPTTPSTSPTAPKDAAEQDEPATPITQPTSANGVTTEALFCDNCGAANPAGARFCQHCSSLLPFQRGTGTLAEQIMLAGR